VSKGKGRGRRGGEKPSSRVRGEKGEPSGVRKRRRPRREKKGVLNQGGKEGGRFAEGRSHEDYPGKEIKKEREH